MMYTKLALFIFFFSVYVIFQTYIFSAVKITDSHLAYCMKLLLNHFQNIGIITLIDFTWTQDINEYLNFMDKVSFLFRDYLSVDCLFIRMGLNVFVSKLVLTLLSPIIFTMLLSTFWFCYIIFKGKRFKRVFGQKTKLTFFIVFYILYPDILKRNFSLLNCRLIDDKINKKVLTSAPSVECWKSDHLKLILTIFLPAISFWGLGVLIYIYIKMRNNEISINKFYSASFQKAITNRRRNLSKVFQGIFDEKAIQTEGKRDEEKKFEGIPVTNILLKDIMILSVDQICTKEK